MAKNSKAVDDYRAGKEKAVKALVGYVMKTTHGRADAKKAEGLLIKLLA